MMDLEELLKLAEGKKAVPGSQEWAQFLADHPPAHGKGVLIVGMRESRGYLVKPDIEIHCSNRVCNRKMFFEIIDDFSERLSNYFSYVFLKYQCKHCEETGKTIAVMLRCDAKTHDCFAIKLGEYPNFRPYVSREVLSFFDKNHVDLFKKGLRSESQGLGIGAFSYYRQVVEDLKDKLIDRIIEIVKMEKGDGVDIEVFEEAKREKQFKNALNKIKGVMPDSLKYQTHNPLGLLHSEISDGLHNWDDSECLQMAQTIRVVLVWLVQRMSNLLKSDEGLKEAVAALIKANKRDSDVSIPKKSLQSEIESSDVASK